MDLKSGETIWQLKDGPPRKYPPLTENIDCDVAIIGGGITGALVACELTRHGADCVIIDKREPGTGSTSASTALLVYELDMPLCELAGRIGERNAAQCYRESVEAIGKIERLAQELRIDCDFRRRKSLYLAERESDVADLRRECAMRQKHGIEVEIWRREQIEHCFSFTRPAALMSGDAAEIDIAKFHSALLEQCARTGARIFAQTEMARHSRHSDTSTLVTQNGNRINARKIVFATGYESEKYLRRKIGSLKSTFAIATQPLADFSGWHERCLIWTTARPYPYLRATTDHRAIIGGEDIDFENEELRDALLPQKTERLAKTFRSFFPHIDFEVACAWAGTFGETADSLAWIGEPPEFPGAYFALGYGGNGITYGMIAAEIIRDAYFGKTHPAAHLFGFNR